MRGDTLPLGTSSLWRGLEGRGGRIQKAHNHAWNRAQALIMMTSAFPMRILSFCYNPSLLSPQRLRRPSTLRRDSFQEFRLSFNWIISFFKSLCDCIHRCFLIVKRHRGRMVVKVRLNRYDAINTFQDRTYPGRGARSDASGNSKFHCFFSGRCTLKGCAKKQKTANQYRYNDSSLFHGSLLVKVEGPCCQLNTDSADHMNA